eukprot:6817406-Prorocentrum_lima.AAC.1
MILETGGSRDREHQKAVRALEETAQIHHDAVVKGHKKEFEEQLQLKQASFEEQLQLKQSNSNHDPSV